MSGPPTAATTVSPSAPAAARAACTAWLACWGPDTVSIGAMPCPAITTSERRRSRASTFTEPAPTSTPTAFGLPKSFVNIDLDRQRDIVAAKTGAAFGGDTLAVFADDAVVEKMISRFLARAQIAEGAAATSPASVALALLQRGGGSGPSGLLNLLASNR